MAKLTVKHLNIKGKKVLLRVDFNVPLDDEQHITNDTRIRKSLPTIEYILKQNGILIITSHQLPIQADIYGNGRVRDGADGDTIDTAACNG